MKYRSPNERTRIADELNHENEVALLNPFKILAYSMFLVPAGIALVLKYKVAIDTFAFKHPLFTGVSLIIISVIGMVWIVRKMMWS